MAAVKVLGTNLPVETKISKDVKDSEAVSVEVEALYAVLERANPASYCPSGLTVESHHLTSTGDGMGKLTIRCIQYESGLQFAPIRTTFHVGMEPVQYDLEDHPHLADGREEIMKWLATDEAKRIVGNDFKYSDQDGNLKTVSNANAKKFCAAYMAGIKTFNRYYPVIDKISVWKNPPGLNRSGRSFTGGSPTFSSNSGRYDAPPIALNGYPSSNWFKSDDDWQENANKTWTRKEQWTYTPEGSGSAHAWIYNTL